MPGSQADRYRPNRNPPHLPPSYLPESLPTAPAPSHSAPLCSRLLCRCTKSRQQTWRLWRRPSWGCSRRGAPASSSCSFRTTRKTPRPRIRAWTSTQPQPKQSSSKSPPPPPLPPVLLPALIAPSAAIGRQQVWTGREHGGLHRPRAGAVQRRRLSAEPREGDGAQSEGVPRHRLEPLNRISVAISVVTTASHCGLTSFSAVSTAVRQLYSESITRFRGASPYIYPLYGLGELPQVQRLVTGRRVRASLDCDKPPRFCPMAFGGGCGPHFLFLSTGTRPVPPVHLCFGTSTFHHSPPLFLLHPLTRPPSLPPVRQAFARLSAVYGGTYMLAKPDCKVPILHSFCYHTSELRPLTGARGGAGGVRRDGRSGGGDVRGGDCQGPHGGVRPLLPAQQGTGYRHTAPLPPLSENTVWFWVLEHSGNCFAPCHARQQ